MEANVRMKCKSPEGVYICIRCRVLERVDFSVEDMMVNLDMLHLLVAATY